MSFGTLVFVSVARGENVSSAYWCKLCLLLSSLCKLINKNESVWQENEKKETGKAAHHYQQLHNMSLSRNTNILSLVFSTFWWISLLFMRIQNSVQTEVLITDILSVTILSLHNIIFHTWWKKTFIYKFELNFVLRHLCME